MMMIVFTLAIQSIYMIVIIEAEW